MKIPDDPLDLPALFKGLKVTDLRVLDLGSGRLDSPLSIHMRELPFDTLVLTESWMRSYRDLNILKNSRLIKARDCFIWKIDVRDFRNAGYNVVTMLDIIEHLGKDEALSLIDRHQNDTLNRILIWVPIGVCPQEDLEGNPFQPFINVANNSRFLTRTN